ncbi:MAG: hypothetical protein WBQ32_12480 [Ignavibacteriaceae bacterium]
MLIIIKKLLTQETYACSERESRRGKFKKQLGHRGDALRKPRISILKYLGEENEITLKHRRDFGSA